MAELKFIFGTKRNPIVIHLGHYEGRPRVDIRKHFPSKKDPNELLPTRKGISLNHSQIEQFVGIINSKKKSIDDFFQGKNATSKSETFIVEKPLMGRSFNVEFSNGETKVIISNEISHLKNKSSEELLTLLLEIFFRAALDAVEDPDDFDMLMNKVNFFLNRII